MKPEFTLKQTKPNKIVLYAKGDLTTQWSYVFKEQLIQLQEQVVDQSKELDIVISLQEVTAVDVSAFQLLHVFRVLMNSLDCTVAIFPPDLRSIVELITKSGWNHILFSEDIKILTPN